MEEKNNQFPSIQIWETDYGFAIFNFWVSNISTCFYKMLHCESTTRLHELPLINSNWNLVNTLTSETIKDEQNLSDIFTACILLAASGGHKSEAKHVCLQKSLSQLIFIKIHHSSPLTPLLLYDARICSFVFAQVAKHSNSPAAAIFQAQHFMCIRRICIYAATAARRSSHTQMKSAHYTKRSLCLAGDWKWWRACTKL